MKKHEREAKKSLPFTAVFAASQVVVWLWALTLPASPIPEILPDGRFHFTAFFAVVASSCLLYVCYGAWKLHPKS